MQRTVLSMASCLASTVLAADCEFAPPGTFEQATDQWRIDGSIVADPFQPQNHVAALTGEVGSLSVPLNIPPATNSIGVRFRVLAPRKLSLRFDSHLFLRVRLYSAKDNSHFSQVELPLSESWQQRSVHFAEIGEFRDHLMIEVLNSPGPVYIDDVCVSPERPNHAMQPTTGRRTLKFSMTSTSHPATTRALASGG